MRRNIDLYRSGRRGRIGQQALDQIGVNRTIPFALQTPNSALASFGAKMVEALTAKAQENREREDRDAYMAALSKEKEFDPSTMPPPEESNLLAGEREIMAQALLAGEPSLGISAEKFFPHFTESQGLIRQNVNDDPRVAEMFSDGASDRYESIERAASEGIPTGYAASPPLGTDESMIPPPYAEGFSGGPEALFGADGASDPRMQAALIGYEGREDIGTRAGDLQRHEDELKAAEANFVGREEAMAAYDPTTKYGEDLKYGYQVDQVERDRVAKLKEEERELAAQLLREDYMFRNRQEEIKAGALLTAAGTKAGATLTAADVKAAAKKTAAEEVADAKVEAALLQTYNNEMAQIREPYQKLGIPYPDTLSYEQWKMARNGEAPQLDSGLVTSTDDVADALPDLATAAQALIDQRTPPDSKPELKPEAGTAQSLQDAKLKTARLEREGIETEKSNREFLDNAGAILVGGRRLLRQLENIVPPMMENGKLQRKTHSRTGLEELLPNIKKEHPGLQNATGMRSGGALFQNIPLVSDDSAVVGTDAADFIAARNQIGGSAFMQAYDALKGGGHISDAEGEKATAAILNLDANQSETEFRRTILTLWDEVNKAYAAAKQRKDRLDEYYGTRGVQ
jgi:hypothetical protein